MAISPQTNQFVSQQGFLRLVDPSSGPEGPHGVTASWLVPANGYQNGQRFPHDVLEDLKAAKLEKHTHEGLEYFLVPEESTNLPGRLSHYAQTTGVADLENPPGGGVNRVRETLENYSDATVAPDAVSKYVEDNDSFEEARKKASEEDERLGRQVTVTPAREPGEGKLVEVAEAPKASPAPKSTPPKA